MLSGWGAIPVRVSIHPLGLKVWGNTAAEPKASVQELIERISPHVHVITPIRCDKRLDAKAVSGPAAPLDVAASLRRRSRRLLVRRLEDRPDGLDKLRGRLGQPPLIGRRGGSAGRTATTRGIGPAKRGSRGDNATTARLNGNPNLFPRPSRDPYCGDACLLQSRPQNQQPCRRGKMTSGDPLPCHLRRYRRQQQRQHPRWPPHLPWEEGAQQDWSCQHH